MHLRVTEVVHLLVGSVLQPGDRAVDATAGNGHDTAFLAAEVGPEGHVVAFDIQRQALEATAARLRSLELQDRVRLIMSSHEFIVDHVDPGDQAIGAIMFNLGYLPGADDRTTLTRPQSTTAAIEEALDLLRPDGIVSVVCYRGHEGGTEESEAVMELITSLDRKRFAVSTYRRESGADTAPFAVFIQNRS